MTPDDVLPYRVLPVLTTDDAECWLSGEDGRLRIKRCSDCGYYNHPPYPLCRRCLSSHVSNTTVSGLGTVYSFTVNYQKWTADMEPYAVVLVELDEQTGLRLLSNVVDCPP